MTPAPVLVLLTPTTVERPEFSITGDVQCYDVVRFQYATASNFSNAVEVTNIVDADEDAASALQFDVGALVPGLLFRARIERPAALPSPWSNVVAGVKAAATALTAAALVSPAACVSATPALGVNAAVVPTINITSPLDGATIKGNASVNISATSNVRGTITIRADGKVLGSAANVTSCAVTWSGKSITPGTHDIVATIVDSRGQQASDTVRIQKR